ncbi:outer membrane beta-barrel protein [Riemerella anatipestifer]|uniref:outer membrane beta-barrel protein n=1 Tax=Riemerella anatipestifer TaxID=34085 RepID=UPI0030C4B45A
MKKLFLVGALALFGAMNAQTSGFSGRTFVTGSFGYSSTKDNLIGNTVNRASFVPTVGYFVSPTVAVGAGIGYQGVTDKVDDQNKVTTSSFVFTPMVRKYWGISNNFYLFGQFDVPMAWGSRKATVAGVEGKEAKESSFGFFLRPGVDYFITKNWSVEATVGAFGYQTSKPEGGKSTDNASLGIDLGNIGLGIKYVF